MRNDIIVPEHTDKNPKHEKREFFPGKPEKKEENEEKEIKEEQDVLCRSTYSQYH